MRRNASGDRYFIDRPRALKLAHPVPIEGTLDLHPFEPRDICAVVNEYVREAYKAGFEEIRLIHGRGTGKQRGAVQATLERHPLVDTFASHVTPLLSATHPNACAH